MTRRPDGKPETPADTRFFNLRRAGYTGPIDQDGFVDGPVHDHLDAVDPSRWVPHHGYVGEPGHY